MEIFITYLGKKSVIAIREDDIVLTLKDKLWYENYIEYRDNIKLIFQGKILTDFITLNEYGIKNGSVIHIINNKV